MNIPIEGRFVKEVCFLCILNEKDEENVENVQGKIRTWKSILNVVRIDGSIVRRSWKKIGRMGVMYLRMYSHTDLQYFLSITSKR